MKKIIILTAILSIFWSVNYAKVTNSRDSILKPGVKRLISTIHVYTTNPTDTNWGYLMFSTDPTFGTNKMVTNTVKYIGGGVHVIILDSTMVTPGIRYYVRPVFGDDSLVKKPVMGGILAGTPFFQPIMPTVKFLSLKATTLTLKPVWQFDGGKDSTTTKFMIRCWLNKTHTVKIPVLGDTFNLNTKTNGIDSLIVNIGQANKYAWFEITIKNSIGLATDTISGKTLLGSGQKPWLRNKADSTPTTAYTAKLYHGIICYGIPTKVYTDLGNDTVIMSGVNEEKVVFTKTGLSEKTFYKVRVFASNIYGTVYVDDTFTTKENPTNFKLPTDSMSIKYSVLTVYGRYTSFYPSHIEANLFDDSTCTVAIQSSPNRNYPKGSGKITENFTITKPGTYWARFKGWNDGGEYKFDATPVKIIVKSISTGIIKENKISKIYPNPVAVGGQITVELNVLLTGECVISNTTGQIVKKVVFNNSDKEIISVSGLTPGNYFLIMGDGSCSKFQVVK